MAREYPMTTRVADEDGRALQGVAVEVVSYSVADADARVPRQPARGRTDEQGRAKFVLVGEWCDVKFLGLTVSRPELTAVTLSFGNPRRVQTRYVERQLSSAPMDLGTLTYRP